jgi:hypothetical protein
MKNFVRNRGVHVIQVVSCFVFQDSDAEQRSYQFFVCTRMYISISHEYIYHVQYTCSHVVM